MSRASLLLAALVPNHQHASLSGPARQHWNCIYQ
jgi:hypothetical protein